MEFQSLDQKRAQLAAKRVALRPSDKYRSIVRNFPSMVQSMGIGQAVAFLMAKKADAGHRDLLHHITAWLFTENSVPWDTTTQAGTDEDDKLLNRLLTQKSHVWWVAEREAIEFGVWLKRLTEARTPLAPAPKQPGKET